MHEIPLGPLEQRVLTALWQQPNQTVSQLRETLNGQPASRPLAYTTVLTITSRLQEKGVIVSVKQGRSFVFSPKKTKHDFIKSLAHATLTSFTRYFGEQALAAFMEEAASLSQSERQHAIKTLKQTTRSRQPQHRKAPKSGGRKHA